MRDKNKWLVLLGLLFIVAAALLFSGWRIWKKYQSRVGRILPADKIPRLKESLDRNPRSIFIYDPITSYRFKPNFRGSRHDSPSLPHITNSLNLLGEAEMDPDPDVAKIVFLGDSVTYGSYLPLREVFVSRMQTEAGEGFQLLNAGCPGWSTYQELINYQHYLSRVPAEAVVLVFCLNDLLQFEWVWRDNKSFQLSAEVQSMGGLFQSRYTALALQRLRKHFRGEPGLSPLAGLNNTCLAAYLSSAWARYLRLNLPLLRKIARGKKLIVIPIPARAQLKAINQGGEIKEILYPQEQLRTICRQYSLLFIDPLPAFKQAGGGYDFGLFLPANKGELHLSAAGHRRLAEYLWPRIARSLNGE